MKKRSTMPFSIRLEEKEIKELEVLAYDDERSFSAMVRIILKEGLNARKKGTKNVKA